MLPAKHSNGIDPDYVQLLFRQASLQAIGGPR